MLFSMFRLCHYIHVYVLQKYIVCLCNKLLKLAIGQTSVYPQFKAIHINIETTMVYTHVYTKLLPMSQPNACFPLIVVLLV